MDHGRDGSSVQAGTIAAWIRGVRYPPGSWCLVALAAHGPGARRRDEIRAGERRERQDRRLSRSTVRRLLDGELAIAAEPTAQSGLERNGVDRPDPGTASAGLARRILVPHARDDPDASIERLHVAAAAERLYGEPLAVCRGLDQQRRPGAHGAIARHVGGECGGGCCSVLAPEPDPQPAGLGFAMAESQQRAGDRVVDALLGVRGRVVLDVEIAQLCGERPLPARRTSSSRASPKVSSTRLPPSTGTAAMTMSPCAWHATRSWRGAASTRSRSAAPAVRIAPSSHTGPWGVDTTWNDKRAALPCQRAKLGERIVGVVLGRDHRATDRHELARRCSAGAGRERVGRAPLDRANEWTRTMHRSEYAQLVAFTAIVANGSFARAAAHLGVTPSALSQSTAQVARGSCRGAGATIGVPFSTFARRMAAGLLFPRHGTHASHRWSRGSVARRVRRVGRRRVPRWGSRTAGAACVDGLFVARRHHRYGESAGRSHGRGDPQEAGGAAAPAV